VDFNFTRAEIVARRVLYECGLDDPKDYPISDIILGRGAFYEEIPLSGKEGEIVSFRGRSIIQINSNIQFETKKRFAAGHELGHFEMHRHLHPVFSDSEEDLINWFKAGTQENEANEFAAEFLMPSDIFYNECQRKKFGPDVINYLANRFNVSKTAAVLKFVKRGNHPIAIVYCNNNKMKWFKTSDDFHYFLDFKKDDPPPSGSVAYEMFSTNKLYFADELKQDIWKSDWFRMRDDENDTRFYEYCLFVRSFNYSISIIWEN